MALVIAVLLGCASPCEEALVRQQEAVARCGVEVPTLDPPATCDNEEERIRRCEARCMEAASCTELLGQERPDNRWWGDYLGCVGECADVGLF